MAASSGPARESDKAGTDPRCKYIGAGPRGTDGLAACNRRCWFQRRRRKLWDSAKRITLNPPPYGHGGNCSALRAGRDGFFSS